MRHDPWHNWGPLYYHSSRLYRRRGIPNVGAQIHGLVNDRRVNWEGVIILHNTVKERTMSVPRTLSPIQRVPVRRLFSVTVLNLSSGSPELSVRNRSKPTLIHINLDSYLSTNSYEPVFSFDFRPALHPSKPSLIPTTLPPTFPLPLRLPPGNRILLISSRGDHL